MARSGVVAALGVILLIAGYVGSTVPGAPVKFPEGPNEPPEKPDTLNRSSVRDYVQTYEYRYLYNKLWQGEYTDASIEVIIGGVSKRPYGFVVLVQSGGHSNVRPPENSTATPGPHADQPPSVYRYRVGAVKTVRVFVNEGPLNDQ